MMRRGWEGEWLVGRKRVQLGGRDSIAQYGNYINSSANILKELVEGLLSVYNMKKW